MNLNFDWKIFTVIYVVLVIVDYNMIQYQRVEWENFIRSIYGDNRVEYRKYYGLIAWLLIAYGIYIFVYDKIVDNSKSLLEIIYYGISLGLVIYGAFDFTLLVIFPNYPLGLGLKDIGLGVLSIIITVLITLMITRLLIKIK